MWLRLADGVDVYQGDFRKAEIPLFSHIISDPPYEQRSHDTTGSIRRADGIKNPQAISFAGVDTIRDDLVKLAATKCSGWSIFFCTTEGVAIWRDAIEAQGLKYKTPCIWVKPDAMPKFNGQGPAHGHECMVTAWCGTGYSSWNGGGRRGTFIHNVNPPSRDGRHQTEKPISLMCELISLFTKPGELVCDPCMGSGSTGVAAIRLGRKFVGCEIHEEYFNIAKERITKALEQTDLFVDIPKAVQERLI